MPTQAACASCRWLRVVPGPTPLGDGPYHWCGNLGSPYFAEPVTEAFVCGKYGRGAGSIMADLDVDTPSNDRA